MPSQRHFESIPKVQTTYTNIIKSFLPIADKPKAEKGVLPEATYTVDDFSIDIKNLKDYRRICGFADTGYVPPTYFSVLSQALQMNMMAQEPFPFAMLGLVHIENSVTQYRCIADHVNFTMSVSFANLRDHDKGQQFDFVTKVCVEDEVVWEGTSTYLSRSGGSDKSEKKSKPKNEKPQVSEEDVSVVFEVPEDIGRRYAMISGDFNLIHLHPLTAKAFGFPKAIAHGMWSKAKSLSQLDLPEAFTVDVSFKLPIYLPSEVKLIGDNPRTLSDAELSQGEKFEFGLYGAKDDKPHFTGSIVAANK